MNEDFTNVCSGTTQIFQPGLQESARTFLSPTYPVVREIVQDQSGAEGASGIDAASRVADLEGAKDSRHIDAAAVAGSGCVMGGGGGATHRRQVPQAH